MLNGDYFVATFEGENITVYLLAGLSPSFAASVVQDIDYGVNGTTTLYYNVIIGGDYVRENGKIKILGGELDDRK